MLSITLKIGLNLLKKYSINFDLPKRKKIQIKFIIIHYTGMKSDTLAIKRLSDPKSKVSAHYLIKDNGKILNLVPDSYIAWHAGKSVWKSYNSMNKHSIGIEISNPGHNNNYKNFSSNQISSLKYKAISHLSGKFNLLFNFEISSIIICFSKTFTY